MIENSDHSTTIASLKKRVQRLESSVTDIDAISQEGLTEITALCRMTQFVLEMTGDKKGIVKDLYQVLNIIKTKAGELENCINSQAELLGCNWIEGADHD